MISRILLILGLVLSFTSMEAQGTSTCKAPEGLFASARDSVASINWQSAGGNSAYMVQWKSVRATDWKTETTTTNTLLLRGLQPCAEFEFRVKTVCSMTESSAYGEAKRFKTLGCNTIAPCSTPREVKGETGENKALFTWATTGARGYEVQYQDASNNGAWVTAVVTTNSFAALNLKPCTKYFFHVRSICTNVTTTTPVIYSEWSSQITVATMGCTPNTRCEVIRRLSVQTANIGIILKWDSVRGATYDIQVKNIRDSVWRTISGIRTNFYALTDLATCSVFEARVRVNCSTTTSSAWSYNMRFVTAGCQPICVMPRAVKVLVSDTVAVISWVGTQTSKYVVQYKTEADVNWRSVNAVGNVYILTGLARCKKYVVKVQAICSGTNSSDFSEIIKFESRGCVIPNICEVPRDLKLSISADSIASVSWIATVGNKFEIQYRIVGSGDSGWRSVFVSTLETKLALNKCKAYEWHVRKICDGGAGDWSAIGKFETAGCNIPTVCETPRDLKNAVVTDSVAVLAWIAAVGNKFEVQYRVIGSGDIGWHSVFVSTLETKLVLNKCKAYEWHVRKICDNGTSDWSASGKFETSGCNIPTVCETPRDLKNAVVTDSVAVLAWIAAVGNKFEVQYRVIGSGDIGWHSVFVSTLETKLVLNKCKAYEWHVRKICDNGTSDWSASGKFETSGCNIPTVCETPRDLKNAVVTDSVAVLAWIAAVGNKFEVQYRVVGSGDAGWQSTFVSTLETKITLNKCKIYEWHVRKVCDFGPSDWSPLSKFETLGCIVPNTCEIPHDLKLTITTDSIASFSWIAAVGSKFEIQYRIVGSGDIGWKTLAVTTLESRLTLQRCKIYEWHVRKICDGGAGDWSAIGKFETGGCVVPVTCPTPLNVKVAMVQDAISVTWSDMIERDTVVVQYASSADANYIYAIGTTPNGVLLRGIAPCTTYKIRVVRKCPNGGISTAFETSFKTTGANCLSDGDAGVSVVSLQKRTAIKNIGISPNPGSEYIQVQYDLEEVSEVQIQLLNLQGQVVKQLDGGAQDVGTYMQVLDNLTNVNQGMYFLVIRANGKVASTQKWMKQ